MSIVTGIIVFFITWPIGIWLSKRTSKSEYLKNVINTNKKIINILLDYITTFKTIDVFIMDEIILAECTERNVQVKDIYSSKIIKSILIKEILSIRLIDDEDKLEIIKNIKDNISDNNIIKDIDTGQSENKSKQDEISIIVSLISVIIGIMASMGSLFIQAKNLSIFEKINLQEISVIVISLVLMIEIIMIILIFIRNIQKNNKLNKDNKKDT